MFNSFLTGAVVNKFTLEYLQHRKSSKTKGKRAFLTPTVNL